MTDPIVKKTQKRGMLTTRIKDKSKKLLGYEITQTELRLMPYISYQMVNEQKLDPRRCNQDDRVVLKKWRKTGHITGCATGLAITKDFWDAINEILFLGYVDLD